MLSFARIGLVVYHNKTYHTDSQTSEAIGGNCEYFDSLHESITIIKINHA